MRPALWMMQRAAASAAWRTGGGDPPPATEIIRLDGISSYENGLTVVGGPSNDLAGAVVALGDGSDSTSVQISFIFFEGLTFANLQHAAGRNVGSYTVKGRGWVVDQYGGNSIIVSAPSSSGPATFTFPSTMSEFSIGPYTKSGGGNFTEADINGLLLEHLYIDGDAAPGEGLFDLWVEVTYA